MALQLDRLVFLSHLPAVDIGVLLIAAHYGEAAFHTFTIYDDRLVTAELFTGRLALRGPKDIAYHHELFDFFSDWAAHNDEARSLLAGWTDGFRSQR